MSADFSSIARFGSEFADKISIGIKRFVFPTKAQVDFIVYMNTWLAQGATPTQMADAVQSIYKPSAPQYRAAECIKDALSSGGTLSSGMAEWFSPDVVMICDAGQEVSSEALAEGLKQFVEQEKRKQILIKNFKAPLVLPAILGSLSLILMFGMVTGYLPATGADTTQLEGFAGFAVGLVSFLQQFWLVTMVAIGFSAYQLHQFVCTNTSSFRFNVVHKIGIFRFIRDVMSVRVVSVLSLLVRYGLTPQSAAKQIESHSNLYITYHMQFMQSCAASGRDDLETMLSSGFIGEVSLGRVSILSKAPGEAGKQKALSELSEYITIDIEATMTKVRRWFVVVLWTVAALLIVLALSVLVFGISQVLNQINL